MRSDSSPSKRARCTKKGRSSRGAEEEATAAVASVRNAESLQSGRGNNLDFAACNNSSNTSDDGDQPTFRQAHPPSIVRDAAEDQAERSSCQGVNSETLGMRSTTPQTLGTTWSIARPTSSLRGSSLYCDEPAAMMMAYGDGDGSTTSCSWMPSSPLAGLEDLPDGVIARALWTGFLDSLEVASALRTVSRRFQAIGSNSCQIMDLHRTPIRDHDLANVATAFPRVVYVDLSFCRGIGGGASRSLLPWKQTLRTLSLRGIGASAAVVEGLAGFRQLTSLDLSQSTSRDARKVTTLSLAKGLSTLNRLEQLNLAWNVGMTDDVVEWLCVRVKGLRDLDLGLCAKITFRSIQALAAQKNLRILSLRACANLTDDAVEELVTACPGLTSLDLAHLPRLTGNSLRSLIRLKGLTKLDLRFCDQLTTADVVAFRIARPKTRVADLRAWWP